MAGLCWVGGGRGAAVAAMGGGDGAWRSKNGGRRWKSSKRTCIRTASERVSRLKGVDAHLLRTCSHKPFFKKFSTLQLTMNYVNQLENLPPSTFQSSTYSLPQKATIHSLQKHQARARPAKRKRKKGWVAQGLLKFGMVSKKQRTEHGKRIEMIEFKKGYDR